MTPASPTPRKRHDTPDIDCHDTDATHTLITVTGKSGRGTARQTIRADETLWEKFGEATTATESDRSTVLRDFMRWYVREAGAKLPRRPSETKEPTQ